MIFRNLTDWPRWNSWSDRSDFKELDRLRREIDRVFYGPTSTRQVLRSGVFPSINVTQDAHNFYIRAELPGIKADDLDVSATENTITISGERKILTEENVKYHRREREAGKFSRAFSIPGDIDTSKIEADMKNGILTILIPKAEKAKPRQINVK